MDRSTRPPERKQVTVLFADLCESTAQVAAVDPEEAQVLLDRAVRVMSEAVEAYGGTVSQLLGDGLLALFGAPVAQEDHALRACLAAIMIQQRARGMCSSGGALARPMTMRVGIDSGEVLVTTGRHGSSSRCRVHGTAIHVASRLEQLAHAGTVVISDSTFRLVEGHIAATALGAHEIRGLPGKVELYVLALSGPLSVAGPRARCRHAGRLVGRSQPLADLHAIAKHVVDSGMRIVGLRGEAGIGKSRIIIELCDRLRAEGFSVCAVTAHAYASHIPCSVVADVMRQLMRVPSELDAARQREFARAAAATWSDGGRKHLAAVVDLLELGIRGESWLSLPLSQRLRRIRDALCWLIAERVACGPLLVVIEDICLADADSRRALEWMTGLLERMPVLICTSYRQDFVHHWARAAWFTELSIGALPMVEMTKLASAMLGPDDSVDALIAALVDKSDGNPFFLEQMVMSLVDDGTLAGAPGAYRCVRAGAELRVPASIAAVIAARVDRLPRAAKASLEAAAVLGAPFSARLIASMRELAAEDVDAHLKLAVSAGLLTVPERGEATPHAFCHAVVQEVIAGALTRPRRELLHRAALVAAGAKPHSDLPVARTTNDGEFRLKPALPYPLSEAGIAPGALQCFYRVLEAIGTGQRIEPEPRLFLDPT
jgi:class 3 adenylate cyclase